MVIIETKIFTKRVGKLLTEDEYAKLQIHLANFPASGKIIPESGGLRKIRWSEEGRGKRGGARVIYYWFVSDDQLIMLFIYSKNEADDLTKEQIKKLKKLVEEELK